MPIARAPRLVSSGWIEGCFPAGGLLPCALPRTVFDGSALAANQNSASRNGSALHDSLAKLFQFHDLAAARAPDGGACPQPDVGSRARRLLWGASNASSGGGAGRQGWHHTQ